MEQRRLGHMWYYLLLLLLVVLVWVSESVEAYKNYTVGDSLGWYDNSQKPTADYQKWADDKTFSLGDFLIFNTDSNHSVVQTYNFTTYKLCDYDNDQDKETTEWSAADPSSTTPQPVTVPVPLTKEGTTYFFSGDYDGDQCKAGQHFKINVTHGQGLPPSLKSPADAAPAPVDQESGDDDSIPDTLVPSNFNNPHEDNTSDDKVDDKEKSGCVSLSGMMKLFGRDFNGVLILSPLAVNLVFFRLT